MQERHQNRELYFRELAMTCEEFFIPYIEQYKRIGKDCRVLEIGCGDGGNLLPLARMGCKVVGVDMSVGRICDARRFFEESHAEGEFIASDVFLLTDLHHTFDIILCHDVIEHIGDKQRFISLLPQFLADDGIIFMSFPAWQMPFGGHQQICHSRLLSHLPWMHLFPVCMYRTLLKTFGESDGCIRELLDIKQTRTPIEMFERIVRADKRLSVKNRVLWLINPHYKTKFGLKPRRLSSVIGCIPYLRNFFTTSCFYMLTASKES